MDNRNLSETLPYGKLAMLGIDREKADLLPQEVKEKLLSGEVTPLMQVSIRAQNGNAVTLPLKLQLVSDLLGNPALMAYPVRAALETERNKVLALTEQEAERLKKARSSRRLWMWTAKRPGNTSSSTLRPDPSSTAV